MAKRLDSFGVEVEVGDIVLSCPKHKWSGKPEVGRVSGVFDSGRVTIQLPSKVTIYAYERGAPDVEQESFRWVEDPDAERDRWGRRPYKREPYKYMAKDYTVVGHEWKWIRKQAADITLIVLRKAGEEKKDLETLLAERVGFNDLTRNLGLDYDTEVPDIDRAN
jgi:hypothetical protein